MRQTKRYQSGGLLLEAILFAMVLASVIAFSIPYGVKFYNDRTDQSAGTHLASVVTAAKRYIKANANTLLTTATATTPVAINVSTLRTFGALPTGFSAINAYGQTACALVLQPTPGQLQAVVVTEGGVAQIRSRLNNAAWVMGAEGGIINPDITAVPTAQGPFGSFNIPLTNYVNGNCSGTAASQGRLAAALVFDSSAVLADFLYRYQVPDYPEANRMFTAIDMNTQNITNGNDVSAKRFIDASNNTFLVVPSGTSNLSTVNFVDGKVSTRSATVSLSSFLGNYVHKGNYFQNNNTTVPKPTCPNGGTTNIDVLPQRNLTTDGYQIPAPTDNGATWTVRILDSASALVPGATFLARTYCQYT
jgi:hypothetical protein